MDETSEKFWRCREKVCPICGKKFIAMHPELYVYKKGTRFFCSWTCYRKYLNRPKKNDLGE